MNGFVTVYVKYIRESKKRKEEVKMREENKTLASEIVKEQQEVMINILTELELVENDLEKTEFIVSEIGDLTARIPKKRHYYLLVIWQE